MIPIWWIIWMIASFMWLLYETDCLTVRLTGQVPIPANRVTICRLCSVYGYKDWLGVLTGWDWIFEHEHDLDNYQPFLLLRMNGNRYAMNIRDTKVLGQIIKINRAKHHPNKRANLSKPVYPSYIPSDQTMEAWAQALIPLERELANLK